MSEHLAELQRNYFGSEFKVQSLLGLGSRTAKDFLARTVASLARVESSDATETDRDRMEGCLLMVASSGS